jgi:hypothetical protein
MRTMTSLVVLTLMSQGATAQTWQARPDTFPRTGYVNHRAAVTATAETATLILWCNVDRLDAAPTLMVSLAIGRGVFDTHNSKTYEFILDWQVDSGPSQPDHVRALEDQQKARVAAQSSPTTFAPNRAWWLAPPPRLLAALLDTLPHTLVMRWPVYGEGEQTVTWQLMANATVRAVVQECDTAGRETTR